MKVNASANMCFDANSAVTMSTCYDLHGVTQNILTSGTVQVSLPFCRPALDNGDSETGSYLLHCVTALSHSLEGKDQLLQYIAATSYLLSYKKTHTLPSCTIRIIPSGVVYTCIYNYTNFGSVILT